jgi:hypothetical protein
MSALGQKQTFGSGNPMSALPPKADMVQRDRDVRFVPEADSCSAATTESSGATDQAPGMGRTGITSTASPGKIVKCGWFSKSFAAASFDSARTTVKAPRSLLMSSMPR